MTTFARLLADLARADVDFVTVGGLAVAQAGYARFTEDIGLWAEASPGIPRRRIGARSAFGDGGAAELRRLWENWARGVADET